MGGVQTKRRSVLNDEQLGVFDGIMISDGHLRGIKKKKNSHFSMGVKHKSFASKIKELLPFDWKEEIFEYNHKKSKQTGKFYRHYDLVSHNDLFLTDERKRWYNQETGKKIVPKDIKLTKEVLLWWYIGDGCLPKRKSALTQRQIILCTECFIESDINFLIEKLKEIIGQDNIHKYKKRIQISKQALCNFIKIIGLETPVPEYHYKFDFGQYINEDYLDRMQSKQRKPVICLETGIEYESILQASNNNNMHNANLARAIKENKGHKGLHFIYKNENSRLIKLNKPKAVICVETNIEYKSISNAAKEINGFFSNVRNAIKNNKPYKGFHWKFKIDLNEVVQNIPQIPTPASVEAENGDVPYERQCISSHEVVN